MVLKETAVYADTLLVPVASGFGTSSVFRPRYPCIPVCANPLADHAYVPWPERLIQT
jgi:hypothetical protein